MNSVLNNFMWMIQKFTNLDPMDQLEHLESPADEASESRHKCLSVLLIIRQLMQHASNNADLIALSKVNKVWNFEALTEMKARGCFTARLKSAHPCEDLVSLASLMPTMNVMPFAGISMDLNSSHARNCSIDSTEELASIHHKILDQLPWKKLSVKLAGHFQPDIKCPAFQLLIAVLTKFCGNLEELSLHVDFSSVYFLQIAIASSKFPCLRTFRYQTDDTHPAFYGDHRRLIQAIVSRTTGQKPLELHMNKFIGRMESTLRGRVELVAEYEFNLAEHSVPDGVIHKLRLTNLTLSSHRGEPLTFERFDRTVPVLLSSSRTLLSSLHVDLVYLLPLMRYGISLTNLTSMTIDVGLNNEEPATPQILKLLQAFDFARLFPRVNKVDVVLNAYSIVPRDDITKFLEQGNGTCLEPREDRASNIKHLALVTNRISEDPAFPFLAQMFPHIDRLSLETYETRDCVFGHIWKHWANMKELEVGALFGKYIVSEDRLSIQTLNENLDSEFCGIFPEEVAELRRMDDEYLKAVHIVPVMPSITCLRGLRTFKMLCGANCYPFGKHDATFMFSKVTCFLVFARCPDLSVILETNSRPMAKALSHMKLYASVVINEIMGKFDHH